MPRRALLLAAGLGLRLQPLTNVLPKCLAPIRGRPLLEYWLRALLGSGVDRVLVNAHHHADLVEAYLERSPWASQVTLVKEPKLLGTAGTLAANADFFRDAPFLVAHADNLSTFNVDEFCAAHAARPSGAALTMMTFATDTPSSCGIVTMGADGMVNGFFEKVPNPPGNLANAAVYVFEQEVLDYVLGSHGDIKDLSTQVLPHFVGRMWTWHNAGYHRDIGTMQSWRAAQQDYPFQPPAAPRPDPWRGMLESKIPRAVATIAGLLAAA